MKITPKAKTTDNWHVQNRLIKAGFPPESDPPNDYIWGTESDKALKRFQKYHGQEPDGKLEGETLYGLFPELRMEKMNDPTQDPAGNNWWNNLVGSTFGQYLIAIVAGWLAGKLGFDPTVFKADLPGVVAAVIAAVAAVVGLVKSAQSKVVVQGNVVKLKDLSPNDQQTVAQIVKKAA